tara:strand:+ start:1120 stop:2061 length:942 start_codon:yes stop_codon:yes gene_type:complete
MSGFGQGSRNQLTYIEEVTAGTTPGTPSMLAIGFNTHSIDLTKTIIETSEIRSDRQVVTSRHGNKQAGGDLAVEFKSDAYDAFLESVFFGAFTTGTGGDTGFDVLKNGITRKTFTFEDGQLDLATPQFQIFTGMEANSMELSVAPDAIVTSAFNFVGMGADALTGTTLDASPDAVSVNEPFDSFTGAIEIDGSPVSTITALNINISNDLSPDFVIGSDSAPCVSFGMSKVTGSITAFFEDATLINRFVNETETAIRITLGTGVGSYEFNMPRCKINTATDGVDNPKSRTLTLDFEAIYNTSDVASIICRKATA